MQDTSLKENHFQPAFLTSGCSSITVVARIMGLALFERDCVHKSSKHCLWTFSFEAMGLRNLAFRNSSSRSSPNVGN